MIDIDERLREAGERWRASQPAARPVDAKALLSPRSRGGGARSRRFGYQVSAGAFALGAILIGGALIARQAWAPAGERGIVVPGAHVEARGLIVIAADGNTCLALPGPIPLGGLPRPIETCPPISVPVHGVDISSLPRWTALPVGGYSGPVTVSGLWDGASLQVESVSAATPLPSAIPEAACPPPLGGWIQPNIADRDYEDHFRRLSDELDRSPDRYAGYWLAHPTGTGEDGRVVVVGTTDDPAIVLGTLEASFPYSLCVVRVEYSSARLMHVAETLRRRDNTWQTTVRPELNRVVVRLPLVDEAAQAVFDSHPEAIPDPLVRGG